MGLDPHSADECFVTVGGKQPKMVELTAVRHQKWRTDEFIRRLVDEFWTDFDELSVIFESFDFVKIENSLNSIEFLSKLI